MFEALALPLFLNLPPSLGQGNINALNAMTGSALFFSVIVTCLFYLAAHFFQSATVSMVAKEELAALILSIVIVASWSSIDYLLYSVSQSIVCGTEPALCAGVTYSQTAYWGQVDLAYGSLDVLRTKLLSIYGTLYMFEVLIGFLSTLSFPIGSFLPAVNIISVSLMPFDGLSMLSNAHTVVVEAIGNLIALLMAKQWFLIFVKEAVPKILLPLGLYMRAIPIFRSTGSSIIALCIVMYFVFPLSVMFSNYVIFDVYFAQGAVDFLYTPAQAGFAGSGATIPNDVNSLDDWQTQKEKEGNDEMKELMEMFTNKDAVQTGVSESCGTGFFMLICHTFNFLGTAVNAVVGFVTSTYKIATFMWSFGGDFITGLITGQLFLPTSAAVGLYDFIIDEVVMVSQFMVAIVVMSVIEIIITVTMYRNIALMIGGEVEIMGLSKLV